MIASGPICSLCGVEYIAEYDGPCQEPRCSGVVSWEATANKLAAQLRAMVGPFTDAELVALRTAVKFTLLESITTDYVTDDNRRIVGPATNDSLVSAARKLGGLDVETGSDSGYRTTVWD